LRYEYISMEGLSKVLCPSLLQLNINTRNIHTLCANIANINSPGITSIESKLIKTKKFPLHCNECLIKYNELTKLIICIINKMPNIEKISLHIIIKNNPETIDINQTKNFINHELFNLKEYEIDIQFYETAPLGCIDVKILGQNEKLFDIWFTKNIQQLNINEGTLLLYINSRKDDNDIDRINIHDDEEKIINAIFNKELNSHGHPSQKRRQHKRCKNGIQR
ncbi:unnamed protein product, partial [Adineta steineri]